MNVLNTLKGERSTLSAVLFLFAITLLYFFSVLFSDQTFATRDIFLFFYPRRLFAADCIWSGILPLWNPHLACGVPFLANLQSSVFYPLSVIYYILPFQAGFTCFIVLHYFLAGLFMFLLMRNWKYDILSSITAAMVFMFGGYMVSILDNVAFLTSGVWLPLIVLFFDRSLREKRPVWLVLTGVAIGVQILGGDASSYVLSTFVFMGAYLLYVVSSKRHLPMGEKGRLFLALPLAWIIGLSLAAVTLVPFIEFVSCSTRAEGLSYGTLTRWSYHPLELFQLLVPFIFGTTVPMCRWFGQFWLDTFYMGVFPLLMVVFCIFWSAGRFRLFLLSIVFLSLFMAFGSYNPLFDLMATLPGVNRVQYPVKYLFLASFSLSLLSGMGFSSLFGSLEHKKQGRGFSAFLIAANSTVLVLLFAGLVMDERLFALFKDIYPQTLYHKIVGVGSAYLAFFSGCSRFVLLSISAGLILVLTRGGVIPVKVSKVLCLVLLLADLMFIGRPHDPTVQSSLYTKPPETVTLLETDSSPFRIFSLSYSTFRDFMHVPEIPFSVTFETLKSFLMPNLSLIFRLDTIDEYAAILVKRYYDLFSPVKEFFRPEERDARQSRYSKEVLAMLNVKYLISSFSMEDEDFRLVQGGPVKIYEYPGALPRAYVVPGVTVLEDDEAVLRALENGRFNARGSILITREEYGKADHNGNKAKALSPHRYKGEAKILKYSPNSVEIETNGNGSAFLVLADNFYPGWKVYVNGREGTILRVNYNLRGVAVPPGKHKVTFSYVPLSFVIGAAVTLLTALSIIIYIFVSARRQRVDLAGSATPAWPPCPPRPGSAARQ